MGFFTKKEVVNRYEETVLNTRGKLASVAASLALLYASFNDGMIDILGDKPGQRTQAEAKAMAQENYDTAFNQLSPASKFVAQYAGVTKIRVDSSPGGNGVLGLIEEGKDYLAIINNGCLENTAYDIDGGEFKFSVRGIFSKTTVEGSVPTAAAFAEIVNENSDRLRIVSGNTNSSDLMFEGLNSGGPLAPADEQTARILETYGCEVGMVSFDNSMNDDVLNYEGLVNPL